MCSLLEGLLRVKDLVDKVLQLTTELRSQRLTALGQRVENVLNILFGHLD